MHLIANTYSCWLEESGGEHICISRSIPVPPFFLYVTRGALIYGPLSFISAYISLSLRKTLVVHTYFRDKDGYPGGVGDIAQALVNTPKKQWVSNFCAVADDAGALSQENKNGWMMVYNAGNFGGFFEVFMLFFSLTHRQPFHYYSHLPISLISLFDVKSSSFTFSADEHAGNAMQKRKDTPSPPSTLRKITLRQF